MPPQPRVVVKLLNLRHELRNIILKYAMLYFVYNSSPASYCAYTKSVVNLLQVCHSTVVVIDPINLSLISLIQ
jgi:hypothetical protein